ncbi:keratin-associated protein 5-5-like [Thrips palmi]|uniref:Keratin-associated protein 5-5-like n=1 Tax=Thrips palmi TaxID=161013 RepID=A0A6P8ZKJ4_THRPL|nr:keratin-associated protein 5-5-like [Thrips palmi]
MKSSTLLKALVLSAVLVGLIEAAPFHGGCGCASPCGCGGGAKFSVATVPIQLSLPAPAPAPSCGCGSICGGSCGIPAPAPKCGCGSLCGGSCGIPAPCGHHGKCGCGPRFIEVTKCKKFLVPAPRPRCHKCLVPACICDAPAPVCGCPQPCGC